VTLTFKPHICSPSHSCPIRSFYGKNWTDNGVSETDVNPEVS